MRECNRSAFFSKRVYWSTTPFLAVAMIVRTTCEIFEAAAADKGVKLICTTPSSPAIITAHAIVAFYRGTISVTSAPAHGTTFTISLPTVETSR